MSYTLPKASLEQEDVVKSIINGNNVIVDSVAGSGKTTTILHLAHLLKISDEKQRILLLTYNSKLKIETREKARQLGLTNLEVRSYHSFAVRYYDNNAYTDLQLINVVENLKSSILPKYDIIIVDEVQDMTDLYFKLVCILIRDHRLLHSFDKVRFMIIGDIRQNIYNYKGADYKFLKFGPQIFKELTSIVKWDEHKLTMSYRITNQIASFVNNVMLKENKLFANKDNLRVQYVMLDAFDNFECNELSSYTVLNDLLKANDYNYDDFFILGYSVKGQNMPIRKLANRLSDDGHPIFVPGNDEEKIDETLLKGKIAFSTFHQSKGLERRFVIVFGFDDSYYKCYDKNGDQKQCPNLLYVAATRAKEGLYLLHHKRNDFLPFINVEDLKKYANVVGNLSIQNTHSSGKCDIAVSKITDYKNEMVINNALNHFTYKIEVVNSHELSIVNRVNFNYGKHNASLVETVAEINGTALAAYYEFHTTKRCTIVDYLLMMDQTCGDLSYIGSKKLHTVFDPIGLKFPNITLDEFTKIAMIYCSTRSGFIYKLNELGESKWLDINIYQQVYLRMSQYLSKNCLFEVDVLYEGYRGSIDIFDLDTCTLWEIKAVQSLKHEHLIQTAVYGYMLLSLMCLKRYYNNQRTMYDLSRPLMKIYNCLTGEKPLQYKLFNILDGQIISITFDRKKIKEMLEVLRLNEGVTQANFQEYYNQIVKTYTDADKVESKLIIHPPLKVKTNVNYCDDFDDFFEDPDREPDKDNDEFNQTLLDDDFVF